VSARRLIAIIILTALTIFLAYEGITWKAALEMEKQAAHEDIE
jgi:hypothetical protein